MPTSNGPEHAKLLSITLADGARRLRGGEITSQQLTRAFLDRIAETDEQIHAFVTVTKASALAQAEAADALLSSGDATAPLTGLPIALKDVLMTKGVRTTAGSRMLDSLVPPYDATVVSRLSEAGAVSLGKTNMDEFAMGSSTEHSAWFSTANPWDRERVPGGSSGGSAAAVAAQQCIASLGSDTGGSIRQPASFCGVVGLKPTYGRVSRFGMVAFASSLDQGGPMARSAADLRLVLQHMEGRDPRDSTSADQGPTRNAGHAALDVGIPREYWTDLGDDVAGPLEDAVVALRRLGHRCHDVSLPHTAFAVPVYYVVASAEASTNLSRYDGVRYGHRAVEPADIDDLYRRSRSEGFGVEVKRRILTGTYTLSVGYYDAYYGQAQRVRRLIRQDFLDAFGQVDVLLTPATPTPAPELGALTGAADPTVMYKQDVYTVPASLAGLPALSIPCGFANGLPVGLQLIGPHFAEDRLLALGEAYQRETDWHLRAPAMAEAA